MKTGIFLKSPLSVQLELTKACNHMCNYCYNYWRYKKEGKTIGIEKEFGKEHFLKIIKRLSEIDIFDLIITGGEPLLRKDILLNVVKLAREKNMFVGINSNITTLTKDYIKKLENVPLSTSFSSYKKEAYNSITGSQNYNKFLKNLEELLKSGQKNMPINMVVTQQNKDDVYKTGEFLHKNFGIKTFSASPITCTKGVDMHKKLSLNKSEVIGTLDKLLELQENYHINVDVLGPIPLCLFPEDKLMKYSNFMKRGCSAGKTTITVAPNGDVRPCSHASQVYGNILKDRFKDIWKKMDYWRSLQIIPVSCKKCSAFSYCSGGCRTNGEAYTNKLNGEDPWMTKPIKDITQLTKLFDKDRKRVRAGEIYIPAKNIRYRTEDKNKEKYLFYRDGQFVISNKNLFSLFNKSTKVTTKNKELITKLYNQAFLTKKFTI